MTQAREDPVGRRVARPTPALIDRVRGGALDQRPRPKTWATYQRPSLACTAPTPIRV